MLFNRVRQSKVQTRKIILQGTKLTQWYQNDCQVALIIQVWYRRSHLPKVDSTINLLYAWSLKLEMNQYSRKKHPCQIMWTSVINQLWSNHLLLKVNSKYPRGMVDMNRTILSGKQAALVEQQFQKKKNFEKNLENFSAIEGKPKRSTFKWRSWSSLGEMIYLWAM